MAPAMSRLLPVPCFACGLRPETPKTCRDCKLWLGKAASGCARYCSYRCQVRDWRFHRRLCGDRSVSDARSPSHTRRAASGPEPGTRYIIPFQHAGTLLVEVTSDSVVFCGTPMPSSLTDLYDDADHPTWGMDAFTGARQELPTGLVVERIIIYDEGQYYSEILRVLSLNAQIEGGIAVNLVINESGDSGWLLQQYSGHPSFRQYCLDLPCDKETLYHIFKLNDADRLAWQARSSI